MGPSILTGDEVDDVLYFARANESQELKDCITELAQRHTASPPEILEAAKDAETGNSALHYAAANGNTEALEVILTAYTGISSTTGIRLPTESVTKFVNAPNEASNTPLHWAALNGHLEAVKRLVDAGADPSITNASGHDAVFEAERNGKDEIVGWFLAETPGLEQAIGTGTEREVQESTATDSNNISVEDANEDTNMVNAST